jgi:hypothetical protein
VWGQYGPTPFPMNTFRKSVALLLIGVAAGCGQQLDPSHTQPSQGRVAGDNYVAIKQHFLLLRGPAESLPQPLRLHLTRLLRGRSAHDIRPVLAQRAVAAGEPVWVFIESANVCLAQGGLGSVACSKAGRAKLEGVSLGVFSPPSKRIRRPHNFLLLGLAPDGITRVGITVGKRRRTISVRNNVFAASGDRPILIKQFERE